MCFYKKVILKVNRYKHLMKKLTYINGTNRYIQNIKIKR